MIKRSRRRNPAPSAEQTLSVHLGMARARQWQRRLWLSSAGACAVSALLWLVGAGLFTHLLVMAAAFGLGLALPVRSAGDWALAWVSGHGLSYATALELAQSPDDPYGFHGAVTKRASAQAARLEPPKQQPWWLPFLVTAVVLAALPVGPFGGRGAPFAVTRPNATAAAGAESVGTDPAPAGAAEDPQASPDPFAAEPADVSTTAPSLNDLSAAGATEAGAEGGGASDAAALDRFLDTLRDQPPPDEPNPFNSAAPSQRSGTPGEQEAGDTQNGRSGEGQDDSSGAEPSSADEQGEQGQGEQGQGEQGQSEQGRGEQGRGEQGQSEQGQEQGQGEGAEGQQQADPGQAEGQNDQGQPTDQEAAGESDAQNAQENAQPGDATGSSPQQGAPGDEAGTPEAGESGEGAGDTPGGPTVRENSRLDTPSQDPEQLQGRLNGGPSNVAGTVRLQGTPPTSQLPEGGAPGGFSRAEERAITEGRIPVEYQDIIRNYFR